MFQCRHAHTHAHTHTHGLHPLPVKLSCCSCYYGCSLRNIVALHVGRDIIHRGKTKRKVGLGRVGLGGACVVLQWSKMQRSRVLHHPINYSHCAVSMTHMLRKISRGCGEYGNRVKSAGWWWWWGGEQDNAPINSATHYQSFYFSLSPQFTSITAKYRGNNIQGVGGGGALSFVHWWSIIAESGPQRDAPRASRQPVSGKGHDG